MVPDWVAKRVGAERWEPLAGGYTRAGKWLATLPDDTTVFVKAAEDELGVRMARVELLVYGGVDGSFLPQVVDTWEGRTRALLVLEDLSRARWPPPYPADTRPLFDALEEVAETPPPAGLRRLVEPGQTPWEEVGRLGICSDEWLQRTIPMLRRAESSFSPVGDQLVHHDIWTDNVCFADRGALILDWAAAKVGNSWLDVGFALLSLLVDGGARPPLEIPNEAGLAAYVTGLVVRGATAPLPAWAQPGSTLREDQRGDLLHALRWASEALGIEGPR